MTCHTATNIYPVAGRICSASFRGIQCDRRPDRAALDYPESPLKALASADLHRLGFIDKRKMQKYDALCLEPVQDYDAEKVKALRERLHLSQAVLASVLNTSTSTVRKWEVGDKRPSGPSQKLLDILERKGLEAVL